MNCQEARDHFPELEGSQLASSVEREVRSHLDACPDCRRALEADLQLRELLRTHAPRFETPLGLRHQVAALLEGRRVAARRRRLAWKTWLPVGFAAAAAAVLIVWVNPGLFRPNAVAGLTADAVHEHAEYTREAMALPAPDPTAVLAPLRPRLAFALDPVFRGDGEVHLMTAAMSDIAGHPAAALTYRNSAGVYSTLFLIPRDVAMPTESRMTIQSYKPYHRAADGRQMLLWKQRGLTYVLVSDLAEQDLPAMFLRIRTAS